MRTVLFYRNFRKFHGGHLKFWDYFNHVLASPEFTPKIGFAPGSNWGHTNPWWNAREYVVDSWRSVRPDVFFVAGRDWLMLDQHPDAGANIPVVNLIQHMRHADPKSTRFEFLSRKAIRICCSEEVAQALRDTGLTQGPLIAIPYGLDLESLPAPNGATRDIDVLIAALKQPDLGEELERRLKQPGRRIKVLSNLLPRPEYLSHVQEARTTVFLPNKAEGFYTPPLEGMALGTLVVCPVHKGEHSIYLPGHNCFRHDVRRVRGDCLRIPDDQANVHFRSQHMTVCGPGVDGPIMADFVGRFEKLEADFGAIAERIVGARKPQLSHNHRSKSRGSRSYAEFYDDRLRDLVHERFRRDIELFGYSFGDPNLS